MRRPLPVTGPWRISLLSLAVALPVATCFAYGPDGLKGSVPPKNKQPTAQSGQNYVFDGTGELTIEGSETQYNILLPTDVLFDFDKSVLRPEAQPLLAKVKEHFKTNRASQIHIIGHTDSKGSDQYNFVLSQKRAKAVCEWMKRESGGYNMCIGRGEQEPLVSNENPDGSDNPVNRQKNRRVTISVVRYPDANKMIREAKEKARGAK